MPFISLWVLLQAVWSYIAEWGFGSEHICILSPHQNWYRYCQVTSGYLNKSNILACVIETLLWLLSPNYSKTLIPRHARGKSHFKTWFKKRICNKKTQYVHIYSTTNVLLIDFTGKELYIQKKKLCNTVLITKIVLQYLVCNYSTVQSESHVLETEMAKVTGCQNSLTCSCRELLNRADYIWTLPKRINLTPKDHLSYVPSPLSVKSLFNYCRNDAELPGLPNDRVPWLSQSYCIWK